MMNNMRLSKKWAFPFPVVVHAWICFAAMFPEMVSSGLFDAPLTKVPLVSVSTAHEPNV
jgi:hypothetical protein